MRITILVTEEPGTSGRGYPGSRAQAHVGRGHGMGTGPTHTQATIDQVLGVYHEYQDMMGQVLMEIREMKQLQRDIHQELTTHKTNMGLLIGVLQDIHITLCRAFPSPSTSFSGPTTSRTSTSAAATGKEALPEKHMPSDTTVPAAADPTRVRKWGRLCKMQGGVDGKTPTTSCKKP